jgi:hypothetical protein
LKYTLTSSALSYKGIYLSCSWILTNSG